MNYEHVFLQSCVKRNAVYAVAAIRTDRKGRVLYAFTQLVDNQKDLKAILLNLSSDCILGLGPHVQVTFDKDKTFDKLEREEPVAKIEVAQMAWPLVLGNQVSVERKFRDLCKLHNVENPAEHTATGDCVALSSLYWSMTARYRTALYGEDIINSIGGQTFTNVRKLLGF